MREQATLELLEREQLRHSRAVERRQGLLAEIEQRKQESDFANITNWTRSLRTLDLQERIETVISIRGSRIADLERRIEEFSGPLITKAEEYRTKKAQQEQDLAEFERFYKAGRLGNRADEILVRRRAAFTDLQSQAATDLELKRGLELLQRRSQPQEIPADTPEVREEQITAPVVVTEARNEDEDRHLRLEEKARLEEFVRKFEEDTVDLRFTDLENQILNSLKFFSAVGRNITGEQLISTISQYNGVDLKKALHRLNAWMLPALMTKLQGKGWDIINAQPNRSLGAEYLLVQIQKPEEILVVREDVEEEIIKLLEKFEQDTQEVQFTATERRIINYYKGKNVFTESKKVNVDELTENIWGQEVSRKVRAERITTMQARIKEKIRKTGWDIINIHPQGKNVIGEYYLKVFKQEEEGEKKKELIPELEIDLGKREVRIEGDGINEIVRIPDNIEWEIFKILANKPNFDFNPYIEELRAIPEKSGIPHAHFQGQRVQYALRQLMSTLNIKDLNPVIVEKKIGKNYLYSLNVSKVTNKGEIAEQLGEFDVSVAPGLVVKTQGSFEAKGLRKLVDQGGSKISIPELSRWMFDKPDGISRTIGVIGKLNSLLVESNYRITWDNEGVWLQEKESEAHTDSANEDSPLEIGLILTDEELRTYSQTKALAVFLNELTKFGKIDWLRFHREIADLILADRKREILGRHQFAPFTVNEIQDLVLSAITKLTREYQFSALHSRWNEEDEKLWDDLQKLVNRLDNGDIVSFKSRLSRLIKSAEREFYLFSPPTSGDRVYWIDLN